MDLSIVVPIFNERENIPLLYERLTTALRESNRELELVFVDDGSIDGSRGELAKLAERDRRDPPDTSADAGAPGSAGTDASAASSTQSHPRRSP